MEKLGHGEKTKEQKEEALDCVQNVWKKKILNIKGIEADMLDIVAKDVQNLMLGSQIRKKIF